MNLKKVEEALDSAQIYGNAFLGPNLWSKDELFPTDELPLSFDLLDSEDFTASGNSLEAVEEKIIEKINTSKSVEMNKVNKRSEITINKLLDETSMSDDQSSNFSFIFEKSSSKNDSDYDSCGDKRSLKRVCGRLI